MKTALQHFNSLPSPYGQMAIEETIRQGYRSDLRKSYKKASQALEAIFRWRISVIGTDFWAAICLELLHLESQSKQDKE